MGIHPTRTVREGTEHSSPRWHQITFLCDDVTATRAELEERGAVFSGGIDDLGFGLTTMLRVPGADDIMLYEARHETAYDV